MNRKLWLTCLSIGLLSFAIAFAACGGDDDPDPAVVAEVEDTATKLLETDPTDADDVAYFVEHITAAGVTYFGYETPEACGESPEDCIGDPTPVNSVSETTIDGEDASTLADTENGIVKVVLKQEGDIWKLNGYAFIAEIPDGTKTVSVSAVDYGYDWDKSDLTAGEPIAFEMKNDGQESHMIVFAAVEDDFDPQVMIDSFPDLGPDDNPAGVTEFLDGFAASTPGETGSALFTDGLEAGKYTFICFVTTLEGEDHVALGMYSEFEVAE